MRPIFVRMRAWSIALLFLVLVPPVTAQEDYGWWNDKHNWDGVTHWSRYLSFVPPRMGPNALPTPPVERGIIEPRSRLEAGARLHHMPGERTLDGTTTLHLPLANGRVAFGMDWMVLEHYTMDTVVRDQRRSRDRDGRGMSTGDVNLNTLVQLVPERAGRFGVLLRVRYRTASGSNLRAVRHTDAPGYSFDLSTGRWYTLDKTWLKRLRPHATLGFLVYQTDRDDYRQNDCLLLASGLYAEHGRLHSEVALAGYGGYLRDNDRPLELRLALALHGERTAWRLGLRHGLQDWPWTTLSVTWERTFNALPW